MQTALAHATSGKLVKPAFLSLLKAPRSAWAHSFAWQLQAHPSLLKAQPRMGTYHAAEGAPPLVGTNIIDIHLATTGTLIAT